MSEWISVGSEQPDSVNEWGYGRSVLVVTEGGQMYVAWMIETDDGPRWETDGTMDEVTHWMPLPEPPHEP